MASLPFPSSVPACSLAAIARSACRACVAVVLVCTLAGLGATASRADVIGVNAAELRIEDDEILLTADLGLTFNTTLEEALQNGVPLYFLLEFELSRSRWYWLDEKVAQASTTYRVSYTALTRQYRVSSGLLAQTFNTLEEVQRYIGRVTSRPVASASVVTKGVRYDAALRLRLDVNQLPKPFQVNALASREWTLSSDWHRWTFTP